MKLERLGGENLAPAVGFSHAVRVSGPLQIVFLAGQTALNSAGVIVGDTIVEQFSQALGNLFAALAGAGGTPAELATLTTYVTDVEEYKANAVELGGVWRSLAGRDYPAMALVGVTRLWDIEALVEVQGTAVLAVGE